MEHLPAYFLLHPHKLSVRYSAITIEHWALYPPLYCAFSTSPSACLGDLRPFCASSWLVHHDDWCVSVGLRAVSWDSPVQSLVRRTTTAGMVMSWDDPNRESKKVSCQRWLDHIIIGSDARGRQKGDYCSGKVYGPQLFLLLQNLTTTDSCGGVCTKRRSISNVLLLLFDVAAGMPRYVSSMKLEVAWWTRVVRFSRVKISFENNSLSFCVSPFLTGTLWHSCMRSTIGIKIWTTKPPPASSDSPCSWPDLLHNQA